MPNISVNRKDLDNLLGRHPTDKELEAWLPLVKGEIKEVDTATSEIRFELQDSNRPDLWCVEGIARQIRIKLSGRPDSYPYLRTAKSRLDQILVEQGLEHVRPFIGGGKMRGYKGAAGGLAPLIQKQGKIADIFGRERRTVSIGLYRLPSIKFPVTYALADPDRTRFRPLGYTEPMSLREILEIHPKGQEYGGLLSGHDQVPLLRDAKGDVLSFPPIFNSRDVGEVQVGDADLFIEVTGTDLRMVMLAVNILAANLHDRGALIEPVEVVYPSKTAYGRTVRMPQAFSKPCAIKLSDVSTALGDALSPKDVRASLTSYGYAVTGSGSRLLVSLPPYRNDLMHPVDVVEDVAISRGQKPVGPIMPATFTVGGLSRIEQLSDKVRDLMLGFGSPEIGSNTLGAPGDLIHRMRLPDGHPEARCVEIENVMSQSYECLRQWVLPSLLRVETASSRSFYPHFLFELGEVVVLDPQAETGTRTEVRLGALLAHANANFSETHSFLDLLCFYLGWAYTLTPTDHPSFLEGRVGRVERDGNAAGLIGELHPEVL